MAAGQPATGIGGIFYVLLLIGMLLSRLVEKVCSILKLEAEKDRIRRIVIRMLPTVSLVLSIVLLVYMNLTGFRFVIDATTVTMGSSTQAINLEILAPFALSFFIAILALLLRKAGKARI
ncbi:hypothetical protein MUP00_09280 [Candidatus Bathyarchaeota archaeon]|nr:hypothetical protein [Candidatus Bathyarchaeota archaeon]